jgi:hypothetical protein
MESIDETVGKFLVRARQSCSISSSAEVKIIFLREFFKKRDFFLATKI